MNSNQNFFSTNLSQDVIDVFANQNEFFLIAHSFGTLLTLKIAKTLEGLGKTGKVLMIDGSPLFFKRFSELWGLIDNLDEYIQNEILKGLLRIDFPDNYEELSKNTLSGLQWETKLDEFMKIYEGQDDKYTTDWIIALFNRFKMTHLLDEASFPYLNSTKMSLMVPSEKLIVDIAENYNLNQYCASVEILILKGNHVSILQNTEISQFANSFK